MSTHSMSDMEMPKKPPHKSASEHRRMTKPIMEKRRRARINTSLNELKSLILDALNKDPSRHSKLEKADILEMTVKHLQSIQRQQMMSEMIRDPSVLNKFRAGFTECATEVSRYVSKIEVDTAIKQRLLSHLSGCVTSINTVTNPGAMQAAFPGLNTAAGREAAAAALQLQIGPMGYGSGNGGDQGAMNLTTGSSLQADLNNNRRSGEPKQSLSTPPPSGSSQFSFSFPPTSGLQHSPVTPTTPSTPGRGGLSIAVSPSVFTNGPASLSSGYNSFSYPSPSSRYAPYHVRGHRDNGSVSPCSRSSLGSLSPASSTVSNELDVEHVKREQSVDGDVWRPW